MRLVLHPRVYSDIDRIMEYYEATGTDQLADAFYAELRSFVAEAARRPTSFSVRERDLRRVNLDRFPYYFIFRIVGGRRPSVGSTASQQASVLRDVASMNGRTNRVTE